MEKLDFYNISERFIELINPTSPEKIIALGKYLELTDQSRIIDFGCGYAEPLVLWAESFGISAIGIDIREKACERARNKIAGRGLSGRIKIICGKGEKYAYEKHTFDVASCLGASFIWGDFQKTIRGMRDAIRPGGRLVIGEPYWNTEEVPQKYKKREPIFFTEIQLLQIARMEGFTFEHLIRSSGDDWDRYEGSNWYGLVRWLEENPKHPERKQVSDRLIKVQNEYLEWGRLYLGWAIYILKRVDWVKPA
jgi:SAM-dependent methyltransferase